MASIRRLSNFKVSIWLSIWCCFFSIWLIFREASSFRRMTTSISWCVVKHDFSKRNAPSIAALQAVKSIVCENKTRVASTTCYKISVFHSWKRSITSFSWNLIGSPKINPLNLPKKMMHVSLTFFGSFFHRANQITGNYHLYYFTPMENSQWVCRKMMQSYIKTLSFNANVKWP